MIAKEFSDIPKDDMTKLNSMMKDIFDDISLKYDTMSSNDLSYKLYTLLQEKINEVVKEDKKYFKCKFLDIVNSDDWEFQKYVNKYVKSELA